MCDSLKGMGVKFGALLAVLTLVVGVQTARAVPVSLELVIAIDVSGSVDATEFALQRDGTAAAIRGLSGFQPFAATVVYWSGAAEQSQSVPWMLINDATSADAFADALEATVRPFGGLTAPGSAINYILNNDLFGLTGDNGFEGSRLVIDVSGDGSQNAGASTPLARDAAAALGITINGLAILNDEPNLATWYANNLITPGGFVEAAATFQDFEDAITRKLQREISSVPEPMTAGLGLVSLVALGLGATRRRMA